MLEFITGAHEAPFSFVATVEALSEDEMTATADFSDEQTYSQCCQNAWPLIVESLAQAAGIHIKNQLDPSYHGYLVGVDALEVQHAGDLIPHYRLVTKMVSRVDRKYVYHCEAFTSSNRSILACNLLLSSAD